MSETQNLETGFTHQQDLGTFDLLAL